MVKPEQISRKGTEAMKVEEASRRGRNALIVDCPIT